MSYKDSDNDGIGDLKGIISKLDYLKSLGIGMIWLSPIYASPFKDNGYDISDYYSINPKFGTMEDFDNLLAEAKKRDIKIVMDLVINHTSSEHEWFKKALADPNSKYRDYYIFRKGKGKKLPNNWNNAFSGEAWEKVPNEENMYYLHLYTKDQPDLNYHNEEVIEEVKKILTFYLDKGVAGFRCDVINQIYKTSLENGKWRLYNKGKEFYESQEGCHKILKRLQDEVITKYDAFLVGETSNITFDQANKFINNGELNALFEFDHYYCDLSRLVPVFKKKFKPKNLINAVLNWQEKVNWIGAYLENHDQRRSVTRFIDKRFINEGAKALAMFLITLKGTIFIYQGEELGMQDFEKFTYEELDDCASKIAIGTLSKMLHMKEKTAFKFINNSICRDHCRTPMAWDTSVNGGFNEGAKPWLKVNDLYKAGINVEDEEKDPNSILNFYKKIIAFRNEETTLKLGTFTRVKANKNVAKFIREYEGKKLLIEVNLSAKTLQNSNKNLKTELLLTNIENKKEGYLLPYEGNIYEVK